MGKGQGEGGIWMGREREESWHRWRRQEGEGGEVGERLV